MSSFGIGVAYAQVIPREPSRVEDARRIGLVLDVAGSRPIIENFDFGTRFAWGMTDWARAAKWTSAGIAIGAGTTKAYKDVYNWTKKHGSDGTANPDTHGLRLMGGSIAMCFLWMGYIVAGVAFVGAVFAPTTFLELDLTGNYVIGGSDVTTYVKAGAGLLAFFHPVHDRLVLGVGPTAGTGIRVGSIDIGVVGTWSPPGAHGEPREGSSHVITGGLVVGLVK